MEVRELKAKDVKMLAGMLGKLKTGSIADIASALEKGGDPRAIGLSLFHIIAADLVEDIYAWLAELIGKTPVELDEMPASTPIDIIKKLLERGDFKSFFGLATQQAGKSKPSRASTT